MTPDMPKDIVNELRVHATIEQISGTIFERAADEIERLRAERDEARLEVCKRVESASCLSDGEPTTTASDYARWCGWDCFKEDGKPCQ
jgi:hypothetical protein